MTKTKSSLYLSQAEKYWLDGDVKSARLAFSDAKDECLKNGDTRGVADAVTRLGDMEMSLGRVDEAKEAYVSALSLLLLDFDSQSLSAEIKLKLAQIAVDRNEPEETERLLDQAEALFDETDNRTGQARVAEMRGALLMAKGDCETALPFYRKAALLYEQENNSLNHAGVLRSVSRLYMSLNRMDQAHDALEKSMALFRENGDLLGEAGALTAVGVLRTTIGDYMLAARAFRKAIMLYGKLGHVPGEGEATFYLARVEAMSGGAESIKNAVKDYKRSISLLDGVFWPELVAKAKQEMERLEKVSASSEN